MIRKIIRSSCIVMLVGAQFIVPTMAQTKNDKYNVVIETEDWAPVISKVVIPNAEETDELSSTFQVDIKKCYVELGEQMCDEGSVIVTNVYASDERGNPSEKGFVTLELEKHPTLAITSPLYFSFEAFSNSFADMQISIQSSTGKEWTQKNEEFRLIADEFKKAEFLYQDENYGEVNLQYGYYTPKTKQEEIPLIIWLHGMGEGGVDPDLVTMGNKVTNLADTEIQSYFDGAYVLAPQAPTYWLDQGDGTFTNDGSSKYSTALMGLIESFIESHPNIDTNRIYIGGCSNGGYMTMRMLIDYPEYFAAAFPICEAMQNKFISNDDIMKIRHIPMWFTHASNDTLALPNKTDLPTYHRLKEVDATNVIYSMYEGVFDPSGQYFMEDGLTPITYDGHFSWIYTLDNHPDFDLDGNPVISGGKVVTIFEWLSQQERQPIRYEKPRLMQEYGSLVLSIGICTVMILGLTRLGKRK